MMQGLRLRGIAGAALLGLGLALSAMVTGSATQPEGTPPSVDPHGHGSPDCGALSIGEIPEASGSFSLEIEEGEGGVSSLEIRITFGSSVGDPGNDATPAEDVTEDVEEVGRTDDQGATEATPQAPSVSITNCLPALDHELPDPWTTDELPIGIAEAVDIAREHADGDLESIVLEHDDDTSTYTITIGGEEIVIDAQTGEVITPEE